MQSSHIPDYRPSPLSDENQEKKAHWEMIGEKFPPKQLRVYQFLIRNGHTLKVSEIADQLDYQNRSSLREILNKLAKKGFIVEVQRKPLRYRATMDNLEQLLRQEGRRTSEILATMRTDLTIPFSSLKFGKDSTPSLPLLNNELPDHILGMVHFTEGEHLRELGRHEQAIQKYLRATALVSQDHPLIWGQIYHVFADMDYVYNRIDAGIGKIAEIQEVIPKADRFNTVLMRKLGHLERTRGCFEKAVGYYEGAMKCALEGAAPVRIIESYNSLAEIYISRDHNKALRLVNLSQQFSPVGVTALEVGKSDYIQAEIHLAQGKWHLAELYALKSMQKLQTAYASGLNRARLALTEALINEGKWEEAGFYITPAKHYYETEKIYPHLMFKCDAIIDRIRSHL